MLDGLWYDESNQTVSAEKFQVTAIFERSLILLALPSSTTIFCNKAPQTRCFFCWEPQYNQVPTPRAVSRRTQKPPAYPAYLAYPTYSPVAQWSYLMPDRRTANHRSQSPHQEPSPAAPQSPPAYRSYRTYKSYFTGGSMVCSSALIHPFHNVRKLTDGAKTAHYDSLAHARVINTEKIDTFLV